MLDNLAQERTWFINSPNKVSKFKPNKYFEKGIKQLKNLIVIDYELGTGLYGRNKIKCLNKEQVNLSFEGE